MADLAPYVDGRSIPDDTLDSFAITLEYVFRELVILDTPAQLSRMQSEATEIVRSCLVTVKTLQEVSARNECSFPSQSPRQLLDGSVGRPRYIISLEQLVFLVESGFSVPQIGDLLGVSVRTVRRRMTEFGLSIRARYSNLADHELDEIVHRVQTQFPMCGNSQMNGHLRSLGVCVQQSDQGITAESCPAGAVIRRLHTITRREYSVHSPLALYHIDGHHKLIR